MHKLKWDIIEIGQEIARLVRAGEPVNELESKIIFLVETYKKKRICFVCNDRAGEQRVPGGRICNSCLGGSYEILRVEDFSPMKCALEYANETMPDSGGLTDSERLRFTQKMIELGIEKDKSKSFYGRKGGKRRAEMLRRNKTRATGGATSQRRGKD